MISRALSLCRSRKISKLWLTLEFSDLLVVFLKLIFLPLRRGKLTKQLEAKFTQLFPGHNAVMFPHARTGLYCLFNVLGLEKGSEIIMTPLTIAEMVNSVHCSGLQPVFVDVELGTMGANLDDLRRVISPKSRAILLTNVSGLVASNVEEIQRIAKENNLLLIEDCSQCYMGKFKGQSVGTLGDVSIISLTNFKICSTLFGGLVLIKDRKIKDKLVEAVGRDLLPPRKNLMLKLVAKNLIYSVLFSRYVFSYFTFFIVYILECISSELTYRLYSGNVSVLMGGYQKALRDVFPKEYLPDYSDLQAGIGLRNLARTKERTNIRMHNGKLLRALLVDIPDLGLPSDQSGVEHAYWRFPVVTTHWAELKRFLLDHGIDTAQTYLSLCNREPEFEQYQRTLPNAEYFKDNCLLIEVHEGLKEDDIRFTASLIQRFFHQIRSPTNAG